MESENGKEEKAIDLSLYQRICHHDLGIAVEYEGIAMKVCVGGTFETIHKGHRVLLEKAFKLGDVTIGLTSDEMVKGLKDRTIRSFKERKEALETYLNEKGFKNYSIVEINDRYGPAITENFDAIVVSDETLSAAKEINNIRIKKNKKELEIHNVGMILADDCLPISSTRMRKGIIDEEGCLLKEVLVHVGSTNSVKINAVKNVFSKIFKEVKVKGLMVKPDVPEQPISTETINGAVKRAELSLKDADFGVGIEAGLFFNNYTEKYYDVQYCAVVDRRGAVTIGHGPGFTYPPEVIKGVKKGKTVGEAMRDLTGISGLGKKIGAVGYLSNGLIDRTQLTEQAVLMAMIPRIKRELYE